MLHWILSNKEWFFSGIGVAAILSMLQLIRVVYSRSTARSTTASPHATVATISVDVKAAVVPTAPSAEDWERQGAALNKLNSRQGETPGWAVGLLTALHGRKHRFGSLHDQVTLALIDLDDQTVINRRHGRKVGDQIIERTMRLLAKAAPHQKQGRLRGDSFFVILDKLDIVRSQELMTRFCNEVRQCDWNKLAADLQVTCSVGVAQTQFGEKPAEWAARACEGVRNAKMAGGNNCQAGPGSVLSLVEQ